jgi:hypothetical protein
MCDEAAPAAVSSSSVVIPAKAGTHGATFQANEPVRLVMASSMGPRFRGDDNLKRLAGDKLEGPAAA